MKTTVLTPILAPLTPSQIASLIRAKYLTLGRMASYYLDKY